MLMRFAVEIVHSNSRAITLAIILEIIYENTNERFNSFLLPFTASQDFALHKTWIFLFVI